MYLDVPVGDAQAVAEVNGHDELLEEAAGALLWQRATLQRHQGRTVSEWRCLSWYCGALDDMRYDCRRATCSG